MCKTHCWRAVCNAVLAGSTTQVTCTLRFVYSIPRALSNTIQLPGTSSFPTAIHLILSHQYFLSTCSTPSMFSNMQQSMKRGQASRPSRPFPTSNRVSSLHALLPRPPPYVSHAFDASNPVSFRRRVARPSTSSGGRHSTAPTRFASSPILFSFLFTTPLLPSSIRFVFPRVFCRSTSVGVVSSVVFGSFVSSQLWFSTVRVVVLHRSREKQGRIQHQPEGEVFGRSKHQTKRYVRGNAKRTIGARRRRGCGAYHPSK